MADQREQIVLDVDERPAVQASARANTALDSVEKKAGTVSDKATKAIADTSQRIVFITDRSKNAINRNLDQFQRKLEAITKSPSERLAGDKDILLKRVAGDPAAIQRVTDLWTKFRKEQDKSASAVQFSQVGSRIKQFVEDPAGAAVGSVEQISAGFGKLGVIAGVSLFAIGAAAKAAFGIVVESGKSAEQAINLSDRLGTTVAQSEKLSAMARIAGVDIGGFESAMRKLSGALAEGGEEGRVGADALLKIGVSARQSDGSLKGTYDLFREISTQIEKLPNAPERIATLSEVFGKGAIGLYPLIKNFDQLETVTKRLGVGLDEDLIQHLAKTDDKFDELGISFDILKTKLASKLEPLVLPVIVSVTKAAGGDVGSGAGVAELFVNPAGFVAGIVEDELRNRLGPVGAIQAQTVPGAPGGSLLTPDQLRGQQIRSQFSDRDTVANLKIQLQKTEKDLNSAQAKLDQLPNTASSAIVLKDQNDVSTLQTKVDGLNKSLEKFQEIKQKLKELDEAPQKAQADLFATELKSNPAVGVAIKLLAQYGDDIRGNAAAQKQFNQVVDLSIRKEVVDNLRQQAAAMNELAAAKQKAAGDFFTETLGIQAKTGQSFLDYQQQELEQSKDAQLRSLELVNATSLDQKRDLENQKAEIEKDYINDSLQLRLEAIERERDASIQSLHAQLAARQIGTVDFLNRYKALLGQAGEAERQAKSTAAGQVSGIDDKTIIQQTRDEREERVNAITAEADATEKLLQLRGAGSGGEIELARQTAAIRQSALDQELQITGDINRYREASLKNQIDLQLKMAEESKREFDNIKSTVANLTQTLFDKPSQFGSQLASVLKRSITEPISQGVGGFFAKHLQPLIYGPDGQHGIAGRLNHISKLEQANHLGDVDLVNGAVPVLIVNPPTGTDASGSPSLASRLASLPGTIGLGTLFSAGASAASVPAGAVDSTISYAGGPSLSTGAATIFGPNSILGGPGGTSGYAGPVASAGGGVTSAAGPFGGLGGLLGGIFHGGGAAPAGSSAGLGGLLGIGAGLGLLSGGLHSKNGLLGALMSGAGGALLGTQAASLGLLGAGTTGLWGGVLGAGLGLGADGLSRGGIGGLGETTAGGALVGLQLGGPIGALIGAGVGAIAGGVRLLFKTASQKTHDKIKSVYGVDVTDQGVLSQITQTIKQSYGGDIDLGIQSQQVRELISLYAMTTGQSSKGIVQTVTPSAFSNTGGQLTQLPTYVNGQPTYPTYGSAQTGAGSTQPITIANVTLQVGDGSVGDLMSAKAAQVIQSSPRLISASANAGQAASAGRRQATANLLSPSFLTS
jgi:hypothetical protein